MTIQEQIDFREQFKKIVYQYSEIRRNFFYLKRLYIWDKDGSHTKAINKALEERDKLKKELEIMLKGKDYKEWVIFSKKLSKLKLKQSNLEKRKLKIKEDEEKLNFDLSNLSF